MPGYDVIVIGIGAMGSAACRDLARRGQRVLGLERFDIPHDQGSSHGDSRLIRLCYFEHPDYVPLLLRSYEIWDELNATGAEPLFLETGGVYIGAPDDELVAGSLRAAQAHDLPHEPLDRDQLRERYPVFRVPDDHVAIFEPRAGVLRPEAMISRFAIEALRAGAEIRGRERVQGWEAGDTGVEVRTERDRYTASRLVIAGGAWVPELVGVDVDLTVTRQVLGWVWPSRPERFMPGRLPGWAVDRGNGTLDYGFPIMTGRPGFKVSVHERGENAEPDHLDRSARETDRAMIERVVVDNLDETEARVLSLAVCMYTNTPDGHFLLDLHPAHPNVVVAGGFSGHGFKFAPVVGEICADLVLEGGTRHPIGFLGFDRFD